MRVFSISNDFSLFLVGRTKADDPNRSGEALREILIPLLQEDPLLVELDGTMGYSSAFLQGAFMGLSKEVPINNLKLRSRADPSLIIEIHSYL